MKRPLSPHRYFRGPGNLEGIPKVSKYRPIPKRDVPLPGTKSMKCPKDGSLEGILHKGRTERPVVSSRFPDLLGRLAVSLAVFSLVMLWAGPVLWADGGGPVGFLFWLGCVLTHIAAVFSQFHHACDSQRGGWAILILYGGMILSLLATWLTG